MLEKKREMAQATQQAKMPIPNAFEIEENENDSIDSSKLPNKMRETSMSDTSQNEEERKEQAQY